MIFVVSCNAPPQAFDADWGELAKPLFDTLVAQGGLPCEITGEPGFQCRHCCFVKTEVRDGLRRDYRRKPRKRRRKRTP